MEKNLEKDFEKFKRELGKYLRSKQLAGFVSKNQKLSCMKIILTDSEVKHETLTRKIISKLWENFNNQSKISDLDIQLIVCQNADETLKIDPEYIFDREQIDNILRDIFFPRLFKNPKNKEEVELNSHYAKYRNALLEQLNNASVHNYVDIMTDNILYVFNQKQSEFSPKEKLEKACSLISEISEEQKEKIIDAYRQEITSEDSEHCKIMINYTKLAKKHAKHKE